MPRDNIFEHRNMIEDEVALAALDQTPTLFFPDRYVAGGGRETGWSHPELPFSAILTTNWDAEVCFVQYHHGRRIRLNRQDPPPPDLTFNLVALDFDAVPRAPISNEQWVEGLTASRAADPQPNVAYRTLRGIRWIYLIEPVSDVTRFEARRNAFLGRARGFLGTAGWKLDLTKNWNAFFRAPRIVYEQDGAQVNRHGAPVYLWHTRRVALPAATPQAPPAPAPAVAAVGRGVLAATRWLSDQRPAIQGEGGDRFTYWIVNELVWRFRLDDASAVKAMEEWNQRSSPPWSEAALLHKLRYARREVRHGR